MYKWQLYLQTRALAPPECPASEEWVLAHHLCQRGEHNIQTLSTEHAVTQKNNTAAWDQELLVCHMKSLTLRGDVCCWTPRLNWHLCWVPLRCPLRLETWWRPSLSYCYMLPTYASLHSLWLLQTNTHMQRYQQHILCEVKHKLPGKKDNRCTSRGEYVT